MDKVILITGTRQPLNEQHRNIVKNKLISYDDKNIVYTFIHGDCSGVDKYGAKVATSLGWNIIAVSAQWNRYGRNAGPIRNDIMIKTYKPHIVLAFPSPNSKGTYDCINKAKIYKMSSDSRLEHIDITILQ